MDPASQTRPDQGSKILWVLYPVEDKKKRLVSPVLPIRENFSDVRIRSLFNKTHDILMDPPFVSRSRDSRVVKVTGIFRLLAKSRIDWRVGEGFECRSKYFQFGDETTLTPPGEDEFHK